MTGVSLDPTAELQFQLDELDKNVFQTQAESQNVANYDFETL